MPPTPQPRTPEAVDHRGVRVGADERVGIGLHARRRFSRLKTTSRDVLEVHLVADAGRGRHDAEVVEGLLAPAKERVALLVALVVAVGVDVEGLVVAERVDLH